MGARAVAKHVRISPTKVGAVLGLIRGGNVNEAFVILKYIPRDAAGVISKVLKSAVANTENNHELDTNRLFVAKVHVSHGPTLKRFRPMDYGKAFRINKRINNITLVVEEKA